MKSESKGQWGGCNGQLAAKSWVTLNLNCMERRNALVSSAGFFLLICINLTMSNVFNHSHCMELTVVSLLGSCHSVMLMLWWSIVLVCFFHLYFHRVLCRASCFCFFRLQFINYFNHSNCMEHTKGCHHCVLCRASCLCSTVFVSYSYLHFIDYVNHIFVILIVWNAPRAVTTAHNVGHHAPHRYRFYIPSCRTVFVSFFHLHFIDYFCYCLQGLSPPRSMLAIMPSPTVIGLIFTTNHLLNHSYSCGFNI